MISRKSILIFLAISAVVVFYLARNIMLPFVLAVIFAYIFNPVVDFLEHKLKLKRYLAVVIIFVTVFSLVTYILFLIASQISAEIGEIKYFVSNFNPASLSGINDLPQWEIGGHAFGLKTLLLSNLNFVVTYIERLQNSFIPIVNGVLSYILRFLVFLVAFFYLLKDGKRILAKIVNQFPDKTKNEIHELAHKINLVLGGYLRGQIILIIFMAVVSSLVLTIYGVKYSVVLGVSTGFLELIPFIGPVVATIIAASIAFGTGDNNFGLNPTSLSLLVIITYFILRQLEDYFVIPQLLGRLTKLHPLVILFAIITGGAIAGPVGFIISVPVAASLRVLLEYYWNKSV